MGKRFLIRSHTQGCPSKKKAQWKSHQALRTVSQDPSKVQHRDSSPAQIHTS